MSDFMLGIYFILLYDNFTAFTYPIFAVIY